MFSALTELDEVFIMKIDWDQARFSNLALRLEIKLTSKIYF